MNTWLILVSVLGLTSTGRGQIDIESIELSVYKTHSAGVQLSLPYSLQANAIGTGIVSAEVRTPNNSQVSLILTDGEWIYDWQYYSDIPALDAAVGHGTYTFTFHDSMGHIEMADVDYDTSAQPAFTGFPDVTNPQSPYQTPVDLNLMLEWTCGGSGSCGTTAYYMELYPAGGGAGFSYENTTSAQSQSWSPGLLADSTMYEFWISSDTDLGGPFPLLDHSGTDAFDYSPAFQAANFVDFPTEATMVPVCAGDGTAAACPCGNNSAAGAEKGCLNSGGQGAGLSGAGRASLVGDTVVLTCSGELPTALSLFVQGSVRISPVVFGDGLRCVGGTLKRMYAKHALAGTVIAPVAGDPSISARSTTVGDPLSVGFVRCIQVYYRDPDANFCPTPAGNTFNISGGMQLTWEP